MINLNYSSLLFIPSTDGWNLHIVGFFQQDNYCKHTKEGYRTDRAGQHKAFRSPLKMCRLPLITGPVPQNQTL